jgi:membrane protein YdbS with pleckstrin-like domain
VGAGLEEVSCPHQRGLFREMEIILYLIGYVSALVVLTFFFSQKNSGPWTYIALAIAAAFWFVILVPAFAITIGVLARRRIE